jgi:signal transduction histidine kinase
MPLVVALLGLVLGAFGERFYMRDRESVHVVGSIAIPTMDFAIGASFLITGAVAWWRRPESRIGLLMSLTGLAFFIGAWGHWADWNWVGQAFFQQYNGTTHYDFWRIAYWFEALGQAVLVQLILSFPSGRLGSRTARVLAMTAYANVVVLGFLRTAALNVVSHEDIPFAFQGHLALWPSDDLHRDISRAYEAVWVVVLLALLAVLVARMLRASPTTRRLLTPLWFAGAVVAVGLVVSAPTLLGSVSPWEVNACCTGSLDGPIWPIILIADGTQELLYWIVRSGQLLVPFAFLIGLLRSNLSRLSVATLVQKLDRGVGPEDLRTALAGALHDPSLDVVFWVPAAGGYVGTDGRRTELPEVDRRRAVTMIETAGAEEPLGALVHDPALGEQPDLLRSAIAAARLAMENARLQAALQAQLEEVQASRTRIVEATDAERRRIERDLHDGAQQRLVKVSLTVGQARERLATGDGSAAAADLDRATAELTAALSELRELARGIHPAILIEGGLAAALESLAERSAIPASVAEAPAGRLPETVEATAYFVVSEALANAGKHSRATSVTIRATLDGDRLHLRVVDDGVGGASRGEGTGLRGMEDRVAALGGRVTVVSPVGGGTAVDADIPCG